MIADLRATAATFARLRDRASSATAGASNALTGTAGMAGDDAVLGRWRDRYDPMAAALWGAIEAAVLTLGSIAENLTATGNAYLDGEHAATPGATGSPERLPGVGATPGPAAGPPVTTGPDGVPDAVIEFYPGGDPGALRAASAVWARLAEQLDDVAFAGDSAFHALIAANTGATFSTMATYWARQFDPDGSEPLLNAVSQGARNLSAQCAALAWLIDRTRTDVLGAAAEAADDMSPLELPAQLLARVTWGITELELLIGTGALAVSYLQDCRARYLLELDRIVEQFRPERRAQLERLATPPAPTRPAGTALTDVNEVLGAGLRGSRWNGLDGSHPTPDTIYVTPADVTHILDGDPDGTGGGGHLFGTGIPRKSEFPPTWGREKIIAEARALARRPRFVVRSAKDPEAWVVEGVRDSVRMRVVVKDDGRIVTAIPLGGPGVVQNPRRRR